MKYLICIAIISSTAICSKAQNVFLGPSAGFGDSWIQQIHHFNNAQYNRQFNPTWSAGLTFLYKPGKHFGFSIDVKYSKEGDKAHTDGFNGGDVIESAGTSIHNTDYVRIPVKLVYFFKTSSAKIQPTVSIGPNIGFLTHAEEVFKTNDGYTSKAEADNIKDFDFGADISAGLIFKIKQNIHLDTDINYYRGLTDILGDYSPAYHITGHNGNIKMNIGLLLNINVRH